MIFDFRGRFENAFGFMAGNVAAKLLEQGFGEVVKDESGFDLAVYTLDKSTAFDEVLLYSDKEEYPSHTTKLVMTIKACLLPRQC